MAYEAVIIDNDRVFCHPRGNADIKPNTGGKTHDEVNLQKAIQWSQEQGRTLVTMAQKYYTTSTLKISKYDKEFIWEGGGITLVDVGGGSGAMIGCDIPTDNGDANIMVERHPVFKDIALEGSTGQIGIDIGPTYGAQYLRIRAKNLNWAIYTRFGLMSLIEGCFATNCNNGWCFGIGNYSGATWSNSQSNSSIARMNRAYMNNNGVAFRTEHSSGIIYEGNIIEGGFVDIGYEMYAPNNTVVKDWTIRNLHYEVLQTGSAAIYSRWAGGIITVDKAQSGHPAIMADIGSTPGYTQITVSNVPYWNPENGLIFINNVATSWKLKNCDNQLHGNSPLNIFGGRTVKLGCAVSAGYDQVCVEPINR